MTVALPTHVIQGFAESSRWPLVPRDETPSSVDVSCANSGPPESPRHGELPERRAKGNQALAVMERHLARRNFFVNERYSIADISLYAYTHVAHEGGFDLEAYPAIRAWLDRVADRPGHITIDA